MYILSEQQIEYILSDIKVRGVEIEDLQLNLLDHICCIIEYELEPSGNFENFYQKTIPRFFKKELKEIEEETTLLLTFKNYYAMKRTMNTVGIIASIGIVLGAIFKFQHWPGAAILLILGVGLISFVFLPIMLTLKLRETTEKRNKAIIIIGCIVSILFALATVFKIQHWPYGNVLMGTALLGLLFVFVPIYLFTGLRNPENKVNTIVTTILIIAGSGLIMSLSTVRAQGKPVLDAVDNMQVRMIENVKKLNEQNAATHTLLQGALPADVNHYLVVSKNVQKYIGQLKTNMLMFVERLPADVAATQTPNNIDDVVLVTSFMLGLDYSGKEGNIVELKAKLAELNTSLSQLNDVKKAGWTMSVTVDNDDFHFAPFGYVYMQLTELQHEIANTDKQVLVYYKAKL